MSMSLQERGRQGERIARRSLERRGYTILESNYRTGSGEIDLVAEVGGSLVFVEVRTRTSVRMGTPEESITPAKRSHLVAASEEYLQANQAEDREWRIDLVAIEIDRDGTLRRLDVLENAVEL